MAAKVFISYRRDDSAGYAGHIRDRLERELGRDLLFMDVDAIPLGSNFSKVLREEVAKCGVLLAMIGPNWPDAHDEHGNRRLDDPNDFVRIEIAAALHRNIPVIPILLDGARIPKATQLPEDLKELALRNGMEIRHASFQDDMNRLIRGLKGHTDQAGAVDGVHLAGGESEALRPSLPKASSRAQMGCGGFLRDKRNQQVLGWLGGGLVVAATGLWVAFVYFFPLGSLPASIRPWWHRHRWQRDRLDRHNGRHNQFGSVGETEMRRPAMNRHLSIIAGLGMCFASADIGGIAIGGSVTGSTVIVGIPHDAG